MSAIAGRDQILLSWFPDSRIGYVLLDANGNPITGLTVLRYQTDDKLPPSLAWDGREFLIGFASYGRMYGQRVATNGSLLDMFGVRITGEARGFAAAFDGRRTILVTTEWPDTTYEVAPTTRARLIDSFATYTARAGSDITFSGQSQWFESAASADGTILMLDVQGRGQLRHPDGTVTPVDAGLTNQRYGFALDSIAAADDAFLVMYRAGSGPVTGLIVRCIRSDGTVFEPVALPTKEYPVQPAAATDGKGFLVAWNDARLELRGARLTFDGKMESVFPIAAVSGYLEDLAVAWTGEQFVLAWHSQGDNGGFAAARVSATGTLLGAPLRFAGRQDVDPAYKGVAVAGNGNGALVLRTDLGCISAVAFARDGRLLRDVRPVLCDVPTGVWPDVDLVWDGTAYTVVWSGSLFVEHILGMRVTSDGTLLTRVEDLAPSGTPATHARLMQAGEQLYLQYDRVVPEEPYGGVTRSFLRAIDPADGRRRSRAARH